LDFTKTGLLQATPGQINHFINDKIQRADDVSLTLGDALALVERGILSLERVKKEMLATYDFRHQEIYKNPVSEYENKSNQSAERQNKMSDGIAAANSVQEIEAAIPNKPKGSYYAIEKKAPYIGGAGSYYGTYNNNLFGGIVDINGIIRPETLETFANDRGKIILYKRIRAGDKLSPFLLKKNGLKADDYIFMESSDGDWAVKPDRNLTANRIDYITSQESERIGTSEEELNRLQNHDRVYNQDQEQINGYFDPTNKFRQIIGIMQTGDLETALHELNHFFAINYIQMAIDTQQLEKIKGLMNHYGVKDAKQLFAGDIQDDLARRFALYVKTDETPRGLRPYFDKLRDWLIQAWDRLVNIGQVNPDEIPEPIRDFFDTLTKLKPENVDLEHIRQNKPAIRQLLKDIRAGKKVKVGNIDLKEVEGLIKAANARIPRAPKTLFDDLRGKLNRKWAEQFDIPAMLGIDDNPAAMGHYFAKAGGIAKEDAFIEWMANNGYTCFCNGISCLLC
jgi:hypothetical protein